MDITLALLDELKHVKITKPLEKADWLKFKTAQFHIGSNNPKYIKELAIEICKFSLIITFVPLPLHSSVIVSHLYRRENIYVRYLEAFKPMSDEKQFRWDVLVCKVEQ